MKYVAALSLALALALAGGARAISPPINQPPVIVPSPPTTTSDPHIEPRGGGPPPPNTPEPTSLAIAGVGMAAAGAYRLLRRTPKA